MTQTVYIHCKTSFYNKKFNDTDVVQSTNYLATRSTGGTFFNGRTVCVIITDAYQSFFDCRLR